MGGELGERALDGREHGVVAAAGAPADVRARDEVLPREDGQAERLAVAARLGLGRVHDARARRGSRARQARRARGLADGAAGRAPAVLGTSARPGSDSASASVAGMAGSAGAPSSAGSAGATTGFFVPAGSGVSGRAPLSPRGAGGGPPGRVESSVIGNR